MHWVLGERCGRVHRQQILNDVEKLIETIRRTRSPYKIDVHLWKAVNPDQFQPRFVTRKTWHLIRQQNPIKPWVTSIWFSLSTLKHSFLSWVAIHNRLSTGDRMKNWGPNISTKCILCDTAEETRDHLFFSLAEPLIKIDQDHDFPPKVHISSDGISYMAREESSQTHTALFSAINASPNH